MHHALITSFDSELAIENGLIKHRPQAARKHLAMSKDDALAQRRLASFLKRLPDSRYLMLIHTWEQLHHWKMHRGFYKKVSRCWKAMHKGEDDPLRPIVEAGEINWGTYNHVWLTVLFYERLWELLALAFADVIPEINRLGLFQPKTASLLFQWIAFDDANTHFAVCLEPYREVSSHKLAENYRLISKVLTGKRPLFRKQRLRNWVPRMRLSCCSASFWKSATKRPPGDDQRSRPRCKLFTWQ